MRTSNVILLVLAALLVTACPLLDEKSSGGGGGIPPGTGIFPDEIVEDDGLDPAPHGVLVERLYDAAGLCGWQTEGTIPGGWQPVAVSSDGCTQWIPTSWLILGQVDNAGFSPDPTRKTYAFTLVNPLPGGYAWSAEDAIEFVTESIAAEFGEEAPSVLWSRVSEVGALEVADAAFAFFLGEEPLVGSMRIHFGGCDAGANACFALVMGYWLPIEDLEVGICELTQIDASLQCPGLGTCVEPLCHSWCVHGGGDGGTCQGSTCACF